MVWGMLLPSGFGDFWPNGQFEGPGKQAGAYAWAERLRDHYHAQTDEEQYRLLDDRVGSGGASAYAYYVSKKFISECGSKPVEPDVPVIISIKPHEPPQFFQAVKSCKSLGSLIALAGRIVAVDEAFKSIIEQLEPGVHGFFPIEIRMPRSKVFPKKYYTLVIGQYFDSVSQKESIEGSFISYPDFPNFYNIAESGKIVAGIALRKLTFGDAHLWRERGFREGITFFSNELVAEIAKAELRIPRHYKMRDV